MSRVLSQPAQADLTGYIVRAGTDPRLGVSEEVLGRFRTEGEARQAFLALRLSPVYRHGWAELVAVVDGRTPTPLCWFGDRWPSGTPAGPLRHKRPLPTQSRAVQVDKQGGTMQTKEQERIPVPAVNFDRPRRGRRSRAVIAVVAGLAAATLAIGAAAGDRYDAPPSERPVPTLQVVPPQPTDLPYDSPGFDG